MPQVPRPPSVACNGVSVHGWKISTRKGCIISDKDVDDFRQAVGPDVKALPEMLFSSSRVSLVHEASGVALDFTALGGLQAWQQEALPALQVQVAQKWKAARVQEIEAQKAVQLEYDWTFTTPYSGQVVPAQATTQPIGPGDIGHYQTGAIHQAAAAPSDTQRTATTNPAPEVQDNGDRATVGQQLPEWEETTEQMDRALLMERDPILFFDEVSLFQSELDDNGISQLTAKLRVMPRAWLLLLRFWLRVDGCMVRLRETRLFCRHDSPEAARLVLREQRDCEGTFAELRAAGAPGEGPAYADGDAAAQAFQAVAPVGMKSMTLHKLVLPAGGGS